MSVIHKVTVAKAAGDDLTFILSDDTKDRLGDVIDPKGWQLVSFKRNPIALFNHNPNFPIGVWRDIKVEGGRLVGKLKLAAKGTSERLDELISLVEQGVLRAVSVGFRPVEREALDDNSGILFKRQELLETSLVSVPANPSALQVARSLDISAETLALAFGEQAGEGQGVVRRQAASLPKSLPQGNGKSMTTPLAKRIEDAQNDIVHDKDILSAETAKDEPDQTIMGELSSRIEEKQQRLDGWRRAEAVLASHAVETTPEQRSSPSVVPSTGPRPFAAVAKKVEPREHIIRSLVGMTIAKARGEYNHAGITKAIAERYGEDGKFDSGTGIVLRAITRPEGVPTQDAIVTRAASAVADTTTSGWASQLVETSIADFMQVLLPASVYPGLSSRGLRLSFGRSGVISIPTRSATPTIAGSFVAEGAPIPVRQGAFTSVSLTPKKMAVISAFTRQIAEHSTPAIEGLIRNAIQEDTSVALDTVLLDATAASATRPAGLRNSVTVTTATAGGGFAALVGDIKALVGALTTGSNGNIRNPVWIMNPINALAVSLTQNAGGDFPFAAEINGNRLQGYPVILSSTVTSGMIILVDAGDYVSVEGDAPRFDMSDQATLHMEDTTPLAIGTAGAPNTVAAPVRSLWQTDSMALRMIMEVNWAMRRTGVIAWTQSVTW